MLIVQYLATLKKPYVCPYSTVSLAWYICENISFQKFCYKDSLHADIKFLFCIKNLDVC